MENNTKKPKKWKMILSFLVTGALAACVRLGINQGKVASNFLTEGIEAVEDPNITGDNKGTQKDYPDQISGKESSKAGTKDDSGDRKTKKSSKKTNSQAITSDDRFIDIYSKNVSKIAKEAKMRNDEFLEQYNAVQSQINDLNSSILTCQNRLQKARDEGAAFDNVNDMVGILNSIIDKTNGFETYIDPLINTQGIDSCGDLENLKNSALAKLNSAYQKTETGRANIEQARGLQNAVTSNMQQAETDIRNIAEEAENLTSRTVQVNKDGQVKTGNDVEESTSYYSAVKELINQFNREKSGLQKYSNSKKFDTKIYSEKKAKLQQLYSQLENANDALKCYTSSANNTMNNVRADASALSNSLKAIYEKCQAIDESLNSISNIQYSMSELAGGIEEDTNLPGFHNWGDPPSTDEIRADGGLSHLRGSNYYLAHNDRNRKPNIHDLAPGDIVLVNGKYVKIEGAIVAPMNETYVNVVACVGQNAGLSPYDAAHMCTIFQTCEDNDKGIYVPYGETVYPEGAGYSNELWDNDYFGVGDYFDNSQQVSSGTVYDGYGTGEAVTEEYYEEKYYEDGGNSTDNGSIDTGGEYSNSGTVEEYDNSNTGSVTDPITGDVTEVYTANKRGDNDEIDY